MKSKIFLADYIKRDISKLLKKRAYANAIKIEGAYNNKYHSLTLKGNDVKDYLKNLIDILERGFLEIDKRFNNLKSLEIKIMLLRYFKNLRIIYRIKNNIMIDGWKGDNLTFTNLLSFSIDKRTGLPVFGELEGMMNYIKGSRDLKKEYINKFFREWEKTLEKLSIDDYTNLLVLSNKMALTELDIEEWYNLKERDIKVEYSFFDASSFSISLFQYNNENGLEFVRIQLSEKIRDYLRKGILQKIFIGNSPINLEEGKLRLDSKFESLIENIIINDPNFLRSQIEELLKEEYTNNNKKMGTIVRNVEITTIGVKTPFNSINEESFPELKEVFDEDYGLIIRHHECDKPQVEYIIVGGTNEQRDCKSKGK